MKKGSLKHPLQVFGMIDITVSKNRKKIIADDWRNLNFTATSYATSYAISYAIW